MEELSDAFLLLIVTLFTTMSLVFVKTAKPTRSSKKTTRLLKEKPEELNQLEQISIQPYEIQNSPSNDPEEEPEKFDSLEPAIIKTNKVQSLDLLESSAVPDQQSLVIERRLSDKRLRICSFRTSKLGSSYSECEDEFSISSENIPFIRIAVADGATESLFSDSWANLLTEAYVKDGLSAIEPNRADKGIEELHRVFMQKSIQSIQAMPEIRQWLMYEKLEKGTHATLAAVEIHESFIARLVTVGDSCIFWRNSGEESIRMQPDLNPEDFASFPQSICHLPQSWKNFDSKLLKSEVKFENNFQMILCTDAFACWLAKALRGDLATWNQILSLSNPEDFLSLIDKLREEQEIKNDDVALVTVNALPINV